VPGTHAWTRRVLPAARPGPDQVLIAGDSVLTLDFNSPWHLLRNKNRVFAAPYASTWDWRAAKKSVTMLAALEPLVLACGHGRPLAGQQTAPAVRRLPPACARGTGRAGRGKVVGSEERPDRRMIWMNPKHYATRTEYRPPGGSVSTAQPSGCAAQHARIGTSRCGDTAGARLEDGQAASDPSLANALAGGGLSGRVGRRVGMGQKRPGSRRTCGHPPTHGAARTSRGTFRRRPGRDHRRVPACRPPTRRRQGRTREAGPLPPRPELSSVHTGRHWSWAATGLIGAGLGAWIALELAFIPGSRRPGQRHHTKPNPPRLTILATRKHSSPARCLPSSESGP
jgi:hypothetical protein